MKSNRPPMVGAFTKVFRADTNHGESRIAQRWDTAWHPIPRFSHGNFLAVSEFWFVNYDFKNQMKGLAIVSLFSMTRPWWRSSEYRVVQSAFNAEAAITESRKEN